MMGIYLLLPSCAFVQGAISSRIRHCRSGGVHVNKNPKGPRTQKIDLCTIISAVFGP